MKLELLDAYNIRARLSASILLLAPIAITLFFLFEEVRSFATSSIVLFVLLAFTNYVPTLQRRINSKKASSVNYSAEMLSIKDSTFDAISKERYYKKLASLDDQYGLFLTPSESEAFHVCCESAVRYLRSRTRENNLVQEENINFGFCRNLLANKPIGIIICLICSSFVGGYSICKYGALPEIPSLNYLAFTADLFIFFFWIFGINTNVSKLAAKRYAEALIMAIDTIEPKQ
ncbi:MAG: hypothetical protein E7424_02110 [Ruminococcaceae bacterium]|nr:hypothetical protein [Oscillospiraceae bacterium]